MATDSRPTTPVVQNSIPQSENYAENGFHAVQRDPASWAGSLPASQGLYDNEYEKDACGVGFICHIKGEQSHKIVSDARQLLCAMTHRGATGGWWDHHDDVKSMKMSYGERHGADDGICEW